MAYPAMVCEVMIASPSDVQPERQALRSLIHEWNDVHAEDKKMVLMPVEARKVLAPVYGSFTEAADAADVPGARAVPAGWTGRGGLPRRWRPAIQQP